MNLQALLKQLLAGVSLTQEQAQELMQAWLVGDVPEATTAAILVALQLKGVDVAELTGFAQSVRAVSCKPLGLKPLVDTCGTGGSGTGSFNISTAVAFVGAACGVKIAKHGNRSASGTVGSADVLEYLGVNLKAPPEQVRAAVEAVGVTFLFAVGWHPALRHVASVRRELGIRTVFNLLGPLVNPLVPTAQVLGVYPRSFAQPLAQVLRNLGCERAFVLHGQEGLDEAGLGANTTIVGFDADRFWEEELDPVALGLTPATIQQVRGGTVADNAQILEQVLGGKGTRAQREIVALNASAVLQVGGVAANWPEGIQRAQDCLASGAALEKLYALVRFLKAR
ncbi:anthranilate phosphoribosyltransferase [Anthocerotibacter panamensis]|uniref:anthranilate phosphoribosyltransferase n=1 Tax=Anthocerotibacter panamensis TaxID=2857077 RepID=UPI001C403AB2|nr:anthranilate phosphoribosyltransferase [Anthocerotibacter panamensis]